jgi:F-type H+/Na+-transporting ATPase subunit alpha
MPLEHQVVTIFAGNEGLLDDIPIEKIKDFEKGLLDFIDKNYLDVFHEISEKKTISDALKEKMKKAVLKFKNTF